MQDYAKIRLSYISTLVIFCGLLLACIIYKIMPLSAANFLPVIICNVYIGSFREKFKSDRVCTWLMLSHLGVIVVLVLNFAIIHYIGFRAQEKLPDIVWSCIFSVILFQFAVYHEAVISAVKNYSGPKEISSVY